MKESKQQRQTRNTELVEIGNIAISIRRLQALPSDYQGRRWKRAILHAVQMVGMSDITISKLRAALELP